MNINQKIRHQFIDAMLLVHGVINRKHISDTFQIGPAAASKDLTNYRETWEAAVSYSFRLQSIVATDKFNSRYFTSPVHARHFLAVISEIFEGPHLWKSGSVLPVRNPDSLAAVNTAKTERGAE
jgi:hypothetical protein